MTEPTPLSPVAQNYRALRAAAVQASRAQWAVENLFSPEFKEAHRLAQQAALAADSEMRRLAKVDRQGDWRGPVENEFILLGYI